MKVLTDNYIQRLGEANQAIRKLREAGFCIISYRVPRGDSLEKSHIEVAGGHCFTVPALTGCIVTRRVGGVR